MQVAYFIQNCRHLEKSVDFLINYFIRLNKQVGYFIIIKLISFNYFVRLCFPAGLASTLSETRSSEAARSTSESASVETSELEKVLDE